jgi:hypothetical protein
MQDVVAPATSTSTDQRVLIDDVDEDLATYTTQYESTGWYFDPEEI